jgi:hypothetical protein
MGHHHSTGGELSSANSYPHISDLRSQHQPQSSSSASSSTSSANVTGVSSSGTCRSYASVAKQATAAAAAAAPTINNNISQHQQDSDSQKYIQLLPKQYQAQSNPAAAGPRVPKPTLPDYNMSSVMNLRKSQR